MFGNNSVADRVEKLGMLYQLFILKMTTFLTRLYSL